MTREPPTVESVPVRRGALCCRCKRWTYAPVEVGYIERQSGPGVALWGCPSHAVAMIPGPVPGEGRSGT